MSKDWIISQVKKSQATNNHISQGRVLYKLFFLI